MSGTLYVVGSLVVVGPYGNETPNRLTSILIFYCVLWCYIQPFLFLFHFAKVASTVVTGAFYDLAVHVVGLFWNVHRLVSHTVLTLREQALSLTY